MKNNLILIGPMGAGKSTLGRILAQKLDWPLYDSDAEIQKRTGASIPLIFEIEGESGFRDRETAMLEELSAKDHIVLSTGGGAVMRPENRKILQSGGWVVYLYTDVERQLERTANDTQRPLLQNTNREEKLRSLLEQRDPLYRETADFIITTGEQAPKALANHILNAWWAHTQGSSEGDSTSS